LDWMALVTPQARVSTPNRKGLEGSLWRQRQKGRAGRGGLERSKDHNRYI